MPQRLPIIIFALLAGLFALLGYRQPPLPSSGFDPDRHIEKRLRIVTWNIGQAGGKPSNTQVIEHVANLLQTLDADLVLLQEVENFQSAMHLQKKLGPQWKMELAAENGRTVVTLCQRGDMVRLERRSDSLLVGYLSVDQKSIVVMNLHANAFSARRRNRLIGRATTTILSEKIRADARLLAGDLNLDIDLNKRHDLFTDNEHLDVETYNTIAQWFQDAALNAGSTAEPDRRLDYIFLKKAAFHLHQAGPWKGQRIAAMDHDPVIADMELHR